MSMLITMTALLFACTKSPGGACTDAEGVIHADGESWQCDPTCTVCCGGCTCDEGNIVETLLDCDPSPDVCEDATGTYEAGDTWTCPDGCNTCSCEPDGTITATEMSCTQADCTDATGTHAHGERWTCPDGCNTCACEDGTIIATEMDCSVTCEDSTGSYTAGDSWTCPDECNTCTCLDDGTISSTDRSCGEPSCVDSTGRYVPGDTWTCPDGCNTCTCLEDGNIASTRIACG